MFILDTPTPFKIKKFDTLSDKDREPSEKHGLQLYFCDGDLPAHMIGMLDPALPTVVYAPGDKAKQGSLEGMDTEIVTSAGSKMGVVSWAEESTGYTLTIDYGMGAKSNIVLEDCKVSGLKWKAKPGSVEVKRLIVESPNATEKIIGKVGVLKSTKVSITLLPPVVVQGELGAPAPAPAKPKAPKSPKGGEASKAALDASGKNPFAQGTPEAALAGSTPH
ncbi:MAG: hypothetical protein RJA36_2843 [Pseudomonadota bacterium]